MLKPSFPRSFWLWLLVSAVVLVLDQTTKYAITQSLVRGEQIAITSFFNLVLVFNQGAAFSFLSDAGGWQRWFFSSIAAGASILIIYLLHKHATEKLFCTALSFILGGALGNLWDRIALGHVVDFLDVYFGGHHWPAFNVADSAIFVGAALLILDSFSKKEK